MFSLFKVCHELNDKLFWVRYKYINLKRIIHLKI